MKSKLISKSLVTALLLFGGALPSHAATTAAAPAPSPGEAILVTPDGQQMTDRPEGGGYTTMGSAQCGSRVYAPPTGSWGPESRATCALLGGKGAIAYYSWTQDPNTNGSPCVQGWGYSKNKVGGWYGFGCGGSGNGQVNWENVSDYQRMMAKSWNGWAAWLAWR